MKILTFAHLYLDQLQDMHSCERQLIKALPKMVKAATHPELKAAFSAHLLETREQLDRLNRILTSLDEGSGRKVCEATVGLVKEGSELTSADADEEVRDAGLICAAQKIEHYEIATYGCLRAFATLQGRHSDVRLLEKSLNEEKTCDQSLTALAMSVVNADALA
jgi:ferritin-like metal-binding protein YciE